MSSCFTCEVFDNDNVECSYIKRKQLKYPNVVNPPTRSKIESKSLESYGYGYVCSKQKNIFDLNIQRLGQPLIEYVEAFCG